MLTIFKNKNTFKFLSYATALLYFTLFLMLLVFPNYFLNDVGLNSSDSAHFLSRRASMLMLGFSVLSFFGRNAPHSTARQAIVLSIAVSMAGLATLGIFEFARGFVSAAILQPVSVESILAIAYLLFWLASRQPVPARVECDSVNSL
jgi:hypothetical protein